MYTSILFLNQRRSIRKFTKGIVTSDTLYKLLEAGTLAPSLCNLQPWRYKLLTGDEIHTILPFTSMHFIKDASCIIVCCLDKESLSTVNLRTKELLSHSILKDTTYESLSPSIIKESLQDPDYVTTNLYLSMGASINQICLQATSIGLGTCIITLFDKATITKLLQLPSSLELVALLAVGNPASSELEKITPKLFPEQILI